MARAAQPFVGPETASAAPAQEPSRKCPECGVEVTNRRRVFCCALHQVTWHDRQAARGKVLVSLAQVSRPGGRRYATDLSSYARRQMCLLLDYWNREDRAAGRSPEVLIERKRVERWSAVDLGD